MMQTLRRMATNAYDRVDDWYHETFAGFNEGDLVKQVDVGKDLGSLKQQPGWTHLKKQIDEMLESYINRILHDNNADMKDLKVRASELDSLLKWVDESIDEGLKAQETLAQRLRR